MSDSESSSHDVGSASHSEKPGIEPSPKRRRGTRKPQSCVACRRLKTRCDRKVPCSQCLRRGWEHWCPDRAPDKVKDLYRTAEQFEYLERRVQELESQLEAASASAPAPSPGPRDLASFIKKHSNSLQPKPPPSYAILPPNTDSALSSSGTLVVTESGRSRFMGRSAASEWLLEGQKDLEASRPSSPRGRMVSAMSIGTTSEPLDLRSTYLRALAELPDLDDAEAQTRSYFRNLIQSGTSTPLHPEIFDEFMHRLLDLRSSVDAGSPLPFNSDGQIRAELHKIALVFGVFALGMLVNLELPPNDPRSKRYCDLAVECLVAGQYMTCSTLTCLQALSLVARYLGNSDLRNGSEMAYHIRGSAMRLLFSMGLHRDGSRWKLTERDLNVRRRVFWDAYTADVFSSKDWDRPNGLSPRQFDTKFPAEFLTEEGEFSLKRCQLVCLAKSVLDESLEMDPPPYAHIAEIWASIRDFEESIPYRLRNRAALTAQVSRYSAPGSAAAASPAPSRKDPSLAFKQYTLASESSLCVFTLLRPYFVQAISSFPADPLQSPYADAFLAVAERCSMLVNMLQDLYALFPVSCTRQSHLWKHTFSAAACLSTLIVLCPQTALAPFAMGYVEATISLFQRVQEITPQRSLGDNLNWLLRAHSRANERMPSNPTPREELSAEDAEHLSLVGWRTKLVEQSAHARPSLDRPVVPPPAPQNPMLSSEAQAFNLAEDTILGDAAEWTRGGDVFMNWLDACEPDLARVMTE